jgi:6-phosphogluconolactonase (cycloisomerase 2 family)
MGNFFLFASDSQNNAVAAFSIFAPTGVLTPVSGSPFSLGSIAGQPAGLVMGPANFIYAANTNGSVNAFSVAGDGSLSPISGSPFPAGAVPAEIAFGQSPLGPTPANFLYVTNLEDQLGTISGYSIDTATGSLTPVPGSPFATSLNSRPFGILFDSFNDAVNGPYVYVALSQASGIAGFSVDPNTGALTPVPGSPFLGVNLPVGLAQFQNFLFAGNGNQTISVFNITQSTGALAPVSGSPFSTGTLPGSLVVTGQTLYAPQAGSSGIVALSINPSTGALTPLSGSAFPAPSAPVLLSAGP